MKRDLLRLTPFLTSAAFLATAVAMQLGWGMVGIALFLCAVTLP
ncbi:MAG TPA: hypothetical protein VFM34_03215 [Moraxellaceae bacterium]|nr:hypothetical protein [Moraxellaceae bacterium]